MITFVSSPAVIVILAVLSADVFSGALKVTVAADTEADPDAGEIVSHSESETAVQSRLDVTVNDPLVAAPAMSKLSSLTSKTCSKVIEFLKLKWSILLASSSTLCASCFVLVNPNVLVNVKLSPLEWLPGHVTM